MKVLILRSVVFEDPDHDPLVDKIVAAYKSRGDEVMVYQMPACENVEHWAGYAITNYNNYTDVMICVDFPTALIAHKNKRILLTKPLPAGKEFETAIAQAAHEAEDCYRTNQVGFDCEQFPKNISDYVGGKGA